MSEGAFSEENIRERLLTIAHLIGAEKPSDIRFRFDALRAILNLARSQTEQGIDRWDVLAGVEDFAGFRSDAEIFDMLEDMGVVVDGPNGIELHTNFSPLGIEDAAQSSGRAIYGTDLLEALLGADGAEKSIGSAGVFAAMACIEQARHRILEMWSLIDRGVSEFSVGITLPPTFWRWEKPRSSDTLVLAPWGSKPSTYTVLDMHRMLVQPIMRNAVPDLADDKKKSQINLASQMLDETAIQFIGSSQDYPDAFFAEQDDDYPGATFPVTPSNAALLQTLVLEAKARVKFGLPKIAREPVIDGLTRFIVDQQNDSGEWGVFKHAEASVPQKSSAAFTLVTMNALLAACETWGEGWGGYAPAAAALRKAADFVAAALKETHTEDKVAFIGLHENFRKGGKYQPTETLELVNATRKVDALLGVKSDPKLEAAARYALEAWVLKETSRDNLYTVSFQPPVEAGYAPARITWEQPGHAHMMVVAAELVEWLGPAKASKLFVEAGAGAKLDQSAQMIVSDCQDGCWYDFNLTDCVFPSNMVFNVDALLGYMTICAAIGGERPDDDAV